MNSNHILNIYIHPFSEVVVEIQFFAGFQLSKSLEIQNTFPNFPRIFLFFFGRFSSQVWQWLDSNDLGQWIGDSPV